MSLQLEVGVAELILFLVIVLGFFLPPASIILMPAPTILPPQRAAGFVSSGSVLITNFMELSLIYPPVALVSGKLVRKGQKSVSMTASSGLMFNREAP